MLKKKLRFAILCNNYSLSLWQIKTIESLVNSGLAEFALIIRKKSEEKERVSIFFRALRKIFWQPSALKVYNIKEKELFENIDILEIDVIKKGVFEYIKEKDLVAIKKYNLDFILRFGFGIIRGEILHIPTYGVWSFHHGDELRYRGRPAGFWEIYNYSKETGVVLQKLTEKLDGGIILKKGIYPTISYSYKRQLQQIFWDPKEWPTHICKDIISNNAAYLNNNSSNTDAPVYKMPQMKHVLKFIWILFKERIKYIYRNLFIEEDWNVGFVNDNIENILRTKRYNPKDIKWLNKEDNYFIADPFMIDKDTILVEKFPYKNRKGEIFLVNIRNNSKRKVLDINTHASYPYVFKYKKKILCIPETHELKEVSIYENIEFPYKWRKIKTIINGIPILDPTLIKFKNLWWLFATRSDSGSNYKLYIWYSDNLFGDWKPHLNNPVKISVKSSRPAGKPFTFNGNIYRPAQDCSKTYGKRIIINRIKKLSPSEFSEEEICYIEMDENSKYKDGIHTINFLKDDIILIDGKKEKFSLLKPFYKIYSKVKFNE